MFVDFLGGSCGLLLGTLAASLSVIQICPNWLLMAITCSEHYFVNGSFIQSLAWFVVYFMVSGDIFMNCVVQKLNINGYLLGCLLLFGIYAYGIPGIIYAPTLVLIVEIVMKWVQRKNNMNMVNVGDYVFRQSAYILSKSTHLKV